MSDGIWRVLITYTKGTQKVKLLEELPSKFLIVEHEDKNGFTQTVVQYWDRTIAFDHPERVNKGIRLFILKAFDAKRALEFVRKYPGWHGYASDGTEKVIEDLQEAGVVLMSLETKQFMVAVQ